MAKRGKYRKSSMYPEPFNTLIDIAGGIAMNAIANKMEKKYHYSKKGKINPYKVSAFKIGTGGFKSTEDIVRTGGFLGAMGSFDVESSQPRTRYRRKTIPEDPAFKQIKYSPTNNNKYAWRLNCEDGNAYGVDPCDYETRDEYNRALEEAKTTGNHFCAAENQKQKNNTEKATPKKNTSMILCRVSLLSNGKNIYCLTNDETINIGNRVIVLFSSGKKEDGIVLEIEKHSVDPTSEDYIEARIIEKGSLSDKDEK